MGVKSLSQVRRLIAQNPAEIWHVIRQLRKENAVLLQKIEAMEKDAEARVLDLETESLRRLEAEKIVLLVAVMSGRVVPAVEVKRVVGEAVEYFRHYIEG